MGPWRNVALKMLERRVYQQESEEVRDRREGS